jgi:hypothetical protein
MMGRAMKNPITGPHGETLDLTSPKVHVSETRVAIDTDEDFQWVLDESGPFPGEWYQLKKAPKAAPHP